MRVRDFNKELYYFLDKIKKRENFSLSRWGDGELMILEGKYIDLRNVKNGEFRYDPKVSEYNSIRDQLIRSYEYNDIGYYIGVACSCCVGLDKYYYMKKLSKQKEENLTWANIFVNSNYNNYIVDYSKEYMVRDIVMVVNHKANTDRLPFKIRKRFDVGVDAWNLNRNIIQDIKAFINDNDVKDNIFLIAAGPLANILTYELWKFNKNNTYIDVGSVHDIQMNLPPTRGYQMGAITLQKKCVW